MQVAAVLVVDERFKAAAWQALDAGPLAALLAEYTRGANDVSLTLCGDLASQRYTVQPRGLARWAKSLFERTRAASVLEAL